MIPLRDNIASRRPPIVTVIIIILNAWVFFTSALNHPVIFARILYKYGLIPARITKLILTGAPFSLEDLLPFVTSTFFHGNLWHLISNMWILWLFGDNVEDRMGHLRFLIFYLLCGAIAGLTHIAFNPLLSMPVVGASGAIAGVMGAYFVLFPTARIITLIPSVFILPLFVHVPAVVYLFLWFVTQLYYGTAYSVIGGTAVSGVAWWAHVGGFVGGALLNRFFIKKRYYY